MAGRRVDVIVKFTIKFHEGLLGADSYDVERIVRDLLDYELRRKWPANGEDICVYESISDFLDDHLLDGLAGV